MVAGPWLLSESKVYCIRLERWGKRTASCSWTLNTPSTHPTPIFSTKYSLPTKWTNCKWLENITYSRIQAAFTYQEGPHGCPWPELFPSYFIATVNQRLVWLFQLYFQTVCDCIWLAIDIQLDACQDSHPSFTSISCWGSRAALSSLPVLPCQGSVGEEP